MKKLLCIIIMMALVTPGAFAARFLWDFTKHESAANSDWVIDTDSSYGGESDAQRYPSPNQSTINAGTHETYWKGANSEWAILLVKAGHDVETLPRTGQITFGNSSNAQDLSNYDVFIICEPQDPFTTSEKTALFAFVEAGGGVMMVTDHCGSDRNNNGWDSAEVFNAMDILTNLGMDLPNGEFDNCEFTQNVTNVSYDANDPVIHGPFGSVGLIECHGSIEIEIHPENNSTVKGHAWRNPYVEHPNEYIIVATCQYGAGRVGMVNDSSLTDDGTGDSGDNLHDNFSIPENEDDFLILNLSVWLADDSPPVPTPSPTPAGGLILGVELELNQATFGPGDPFELYARCKNPGSSELVSLYVVLDLFGQYWFHPDWTQTMDSANVLLPTAGTIDLDILNFTWPAVDSSASGLKFWAAMLDAENKLMGSYDWIEWGYE